MQISDISTTPEALSTIARCHYEQWGRLTGTDSIDEYTAFLRRALSSDELPAVLVAQKDNGFLGSVNLVACDCLAYPELTPWLAQLFVQPDSRKKGIGAALVRAATDRALTLGFSRIYLYTSGTLPEYYARLGWSELGRFAYLGGQRMLMEYVT